MHGTGVAPSSLLLKLEVDRGAGTGFDPVMSPGTPGSEARQVGSGATASRFGSPMVWLQAAPYQSRY